MVHEGLLTVTVLIKTSLDNLNPDANEKYSKVFSEFFAEKLGAGNDRGYMYVLKNSIYSTIPLTHMNMTFYSTFVDPGRAYIG